MLYSYGDDVVHLPSGTKFDYEFGKNIPVFSTSLLATPNRMPLISFLLLSQCYHVYLANVFAFILFATFIKLFPIKWLHRKVLIMLIDTPNKEKEI